MDYSNILKQGYQKFLLTLGGKIVPTPYRINIPYQPDRRKYGKSDPETLIADTTGLAKEQGVELDGLTKEGLRKFMEKNELGIDCSGFAYHLLDYLLKELDKGGMEGAGFPPASRTNVNLLTSAEFSVQVEIYDLRPADLIKLNSSGEIPHVLVMLDQSGYAHSSKLTEVTGVHTGTIKDGKLEGELEVFSFDPAKGDGVYRLKALI